MRRDAMILMSVLGLAVLVPAAAAQVARAVPEGLQGVGVTEHLGASLPLELEFVDDGGRRVRLGDYFDGTRPVILTLNYYRCPMLCGLQLNGLVEGLQELAWTSGEEFEIVTLSIDPLETWKLAQLKKRSYIQELGRPEAAVGWHFLTGEEPAIRELAATVGFDYAYDEVRKEYAHAAVAFVCTPDGRTARYLYGIDYPARQLRFALVEAAEGTVGTPWDRLLLTCYHYDPGTRRYAPVAMNIMRLGGGATAAVLGSVLGVLWVREARRRRAAGGPPGQPGTGET